MTNDNNIKRIIQLYFGKHFSRSGRVLFGRWLRAEGGASEKSDMLQAFWEHLPAEATAETREDWDALQRHLQVEPVRRNTVPMYRGWIKYAAVIALMLLTGAATFFVTDRLQPVRHVEMAELFVPYGESRQVIVPVGSQVWVDAGSLLVYPKDFTDTETRTVYLTGEASFTVRKNTEKPFIVKTTYLDVQALGTVFTVASYPADSCTSTILEEGSVKVDVKAGEHLPAILKPNERLVYSHAAHTVTVRPSGFFCIIIDDLLKGCCLNRQLSFLDTILFHLFWNQMFFCNVLFLILCVACDLDQFHTVKKRSRDSLNIICSGNKQYL